jgi:hypothetical protein
MADSERQFSATTHWTPRPQTDQQRERLQRAADLRVKVFWVLGPLFLLAGLWALLWLLTSHTVTATATSCGKPYRHHRDQVSKCTLSWSEHGRSHSTERAVDQPGALGSHEQLVAGGLGPSGALSEGNLELISGMLLGLGSLELGAAFLLRRYDLRSGRTGDGLGR